jgi:hypothetical protein
MIDNLHNQCLALQALAILRLRTTGQGLTIYQRAAQHILPALFDDTPPGYLPKVIVDEDLIDEDATVVNTRRVRTVKSKVETLQ